MFNRRQLIEYACPECSAAYGTTPENAGNSHHCGFCNTDFPIPLGRVPRLVTVSDSPGRPLTPQEEEEVRKNLPIRLPTPRQRVAVPRDVPNDFDGALDMPRRTPARHDDDKRVKLRFGEYAELEADVDKPTRNAATMGFVGAVLALLGVIVAATFGIKKRS